MFFNSIEFIFFFLPLVVGCWYLLAHWKGAGWALSWLLAASLAFYAYWNPPYILLLLVSIAFNYGVGKSLETKRSLGLLTVGIAGNLALLGYFKYANFFVENLNGLLGTQLFLVQVILPLGVSFFTLTQIGYLFDVHRGHRAVTDLVGYALFVSFFPHLLAGPLLQHKEMMPQFRNPRILRFSPRHFALGVTLFSAGLFKKVAIADHLVRFSAPVYTAASQGQALTLLEAWGGATAFLFQIYFDLAAYSEMAMGLALMFNLRLPINIFSPIKASRISEVWSRLHISIWRFMRDYWFLPLALRDMHKHPWHRYRHLFSAMVVNGLWHGAGWMYLVWGAFNGVLMLAEQAWDAFRARHGLTWLRSRRVGQVGTIAAFFIAGVFFRSGDLATAATVFRGLAGLNGVSGPMSPIATEALLAPVDETVYSLIPALPGESPLVLGGVLLVLGAVCLFSPNVIELVWRFKVGTNQAQLKRLSSYRGPFLWRPSRVWAIAMGLVAGFAITNLTRVTEFLYFQF